LEYRSPSPEDNGYEDEKDESAHLRGFIQHMMFTSGPDDLLDTLLVITNICELRALLINDVAVKAWYTDTAKVVRNLLDIACNKRATFKPLDRLENQDLYFPDTGITH
jgi:hypothetical protein